MMHAIRRAIAVVVAVVGLGGFTACGEAGGLADEVRGQGERLSERAQAIRERGEAIRARGEQIRADGQRLRQRGERLAEHVRDVLEDIRPSVPAATEQTRPPTRGRAQPGDIDAFLTEVLRSVDSYWTRTLSASELPEPSVSYVWVPPGRAVVTGCRVVADDKAALYCPADDTIYVAQRLAADLWQGIAEDFPGQRAGAGRAGGDFGLAYVVAHEYAHNIQQELGFFTAGPGSSARPFELQADCMAGLWGNAVYREGLLEPGDVEEALSTALAAGDFDYNNANHHGTPEERRDAWLAGYRSGDPGRCQAFVPG